MTAKMMIYAALAPSALLSLSMIVAFVWSERRWRERERERERSARTRLAAASGALPATAAEDVPHAIPIQRRLFHEALWEDEPGLAPSPRARAISQELAQRQSRREAENDEMRLTHLAAVASLGLAACAHLPISAAPHAQGNAATSAHDEAARRARMNYRPVKWPLKFKQHNFGARCYDTLECHVWYAGMDEGRRKPMPPSSAYGPGYLDNWNGGRYVDNFPSPAEVTWRTKDGIEHRAEIDIGEIFKDELIRHNVSREEMIAEAPNGTMAIITTPEILLEVNDRTIRVYMRPRIPLKTQTEIAGQMRSDWYEDLILISTSTY